MSWEVRLATPARRQLDRLPERLALVVVELILGLLAENPRKVGKPLRGAMTGSWSAKRGDYRVVYSFDEDTHLITVLRVGHRGDIFR